MRSSLTTLSFLLWIVGSTKVSERLKTRSHVHTLLNGGSDEHGSSYAHQGAKFPKEVSTANSPHGLRASVTKTTNRRQLETCGTATCAEGEVCCNPSCSICSPPGGACITFVCTGGPKAVPIMSPIHRAVAATQDPAVAAGSAVAALQVSTVDTDPSVIASRDRFSVGLCVSGAGDSNDTRVPLEVVFSLDTSGSMATGTRLPDAQNATNFLLGQLIDERDMAALVSWRTAPTTQTGLTNNFSQVETAVNSLRAAGGTNLDAGLAAAVNLLVNNGFAENTVKVVVFLTDGQGPYTSFVNGGSAATAVANGIVIYSIGLGSGAVDVPLIDMANNTGGRYLFSPTPNDLQAIFDEILQTIQANTVPHNIGVSQFWNETLDVDCTSVMPAADFCNSSFVQWSGLDEGNGLRTNETVCLKVTAAATAVDGNITVLTAGTIVTYTPMSDATDVRQVGVPDGFLEVLPRQDVPDAVAVPRSAVDVDTSVVSLDSTFSVALCVSGAGDLNDTRVPLEVVFSLDTSESMATGTRLPDAQNATNIFLGQLIDERDLAAIVSWTTNATVQSGLTNNFSQVETAVNSLSAAGGANLDAGLTAAVNLLVSNGFAENTVKVVVFLTDGQGSYTSFANGGSAATAAANGIVIYSIGLGAGAVDVPLIDMANNTGGRYLFSPTPNDLQAIFDEILQTIQANTVPHNVGVSQFWNETLDVDCTSVTPAADLCNSSFVQWSGLDEANGLQSNETVCLNVTAAATVVDGNITVLTEGTIVTYTPMSNATDVRQVGVPDGFLEVLPPQGVPDAVAVPQSAVDVDPSVVSLNSTFSVALCVSGAGDLNDTRVPLEVVFSLDTSESMATGTRLLDAQNATNIFLGQLIDERDLAAIVSWTTNATVQSGLTNNFSQVETAVNSLSAAGGANLDAGLTAAVNLLVSNGFTENTVKVVLFLTDGQGSYTSFANGGSAATAAANGIVIYSIGLGVGPVDVPLIDMANNTGGRYLFSPTPNDLQAIFDEILQTIQANTVPHNIGVLQFWNETLDVDCTSVTPAADLCNSSFVQWSGLDEANGLQSNETVCLNVTAAATVVDGNITVLTDQTIVTYTPMSDASDVRQVGVPDAFVEALFQVLPAQDVPVADPKSSVDIDPSSLRVADPFSVTVCVSGAGDSNDTRVPLEVVFSLDTSGSMATGTRLPDAQNATNFLLGQLIDERDLAALVSWRTAATTQSGLTNNFSEVETAVNSLRAAGGTNLDAGLAAAVNLLVNNGFAENTVKVVVFLTDGQGVYTSFANGGSAATAAANGIVIYSIGLGSGAVDAPLIDMASNTGGRYLFSPTPNDLLAIFDEVLRAIQANTVPHNVGVSQFWNETLDVDCTSVKPVADLCNRSFVQWSGLDEGNGLQSNETVCLNVTAAATVVDGNITVLTEGTIVTYTPMSNATDVRQVGVPDGFLEVLPPQGVPGAVAVPQSVVDVDPSVVSLNSTFSVALCVSGAGDLNDTRVPLEVVFSLDTSESMATGTRLPDAQNATNFFLGQLIDERDMAALVSWTTNATVQSGLTNNFSQVETAVNSLSAAGGANLDAGLAAAVNLLVSNGFTENTVKVVVFLTDGQGSYTSFVNGGSATTAAANGIVIYSIGLGSGAVDVPLIDMANNTGGQYLFSPTPNDLQAIFDEVLHRIQANTVPHNIGVSQFWNEALDVDCTSVTPAVNFCNRSFVQWSGLDEGKGLQSNETVCLNVTAAATVVDGNITVLTDQTIVTYTPMSDASDVRQVGVPDAFVEALFQVLPAQDVPVAVPKSSVDIDPSSLRVADPFSVTVCVSGAGDSNDTRVPLEVVFSLDTSGSMATGTRLPDAQNATNFLLGQLIDERDLAALVSWRTAATTQSGLTNNFSEVETAVNSLRAAGGTNLDACLAAAVNLLVNNGFAENTVKVVVFLTDGQGVYTSFANGGSAATAAANGIVIYSIGLDSGAVDAPLIDMASNTGGRYLFSPTPNDLLAIFDEVLQAIQANTVPHNVGVSQFWNETLDVDCTSVKPVADLCNRSFVQWSGLDEGNGLQSNETVCLNVTAAATVVDGNITVLAEGTIVTYTPMSNATDVRQVGVPDGFLEVLPPRGFPDAVADPQSAVDVDPSVVSLNSTFSVALCVSGAGDLNDTRVPLEVVFSLDTSESMATGTRLPDAQNATNFFLGQLIDERDLAALVSWTTNATVQSGLTNNFSQVETAVNSLSAAGGANLDAGLTAAVNLLVSNGFTKNTVKVVLFLTDGQGSYTSFANGGSAATAAANGIVIYSIGLGAGAVDVPLVDMANNTGGRYLFSPTPNDLQAIFDEILQTIQANTVPHNIAVSQFWNETLDVDCISVTPAVDFCNSSFVQWSGLDEGNGLQSNETVCLNVTAAATVVDGNITVLTDQTIVTYTPMSDATDVRQVGVPDMFIEVMPRQDVPDAVAVPQSAVDVDPSAVFLNSTFSVALCVSGAGDSNDTRVPLEVVFSLDISESMATGTRLPDAQNATNFFLGQLIDERDLAALVSWTTNATVQSGLTNNFSQVETAVNSLSAAGGANLDAGLTAAVNLLVSNGFAENTVKVVVFLTDGQGSYTSFANGGSAATAATNGIVIYSIGLGAGAVDVPLVDMADNTGGRYLFSPTPNDLQAIFDEILQTIQANTVPHNIAVSQFWNETLDVDCISVTPAVDFCNSSFVQWSGLDEGNGLQSNETVCLNVTAAATVVDGNITVLTEGTIVTYTPMSDDTDVRQFGVPYGFLEVLPRQDVPDAVAVPQSAVDVDPSVVSLNSTFSVALCVSGAGDSNDTRVPLEVVFSLDTSGSMATGTRLPDAQNATKFLLGQLIEERDLAALVSWTTVATEQSGLTNNFSEVETAVNSLRAAGGTNLDAGLAAAVNLLVSNGFAENTVKVVVFLTDGRGPYTSFANGGSAETAAANGIIIYSIGLGSGAVDIPLIDMANNTGGRYLFSPTPNDLQAIFDEVLQTIQANTVPHNIGVLEFWNETLDVDCTSVTPAADFCNSSFVQWNGLDEGNGLQSNETVCVNVTGMATTAGQIVTVLTDDTAVTYTPMGDDADVRQVGVPQSLVEVFSSGLAVIEPSLSPTRAPVIPAIASSQQQQQELHNIFAQHFLGNNVFTQPKQQQQRRKSVRHYYRGRSRSYSSYRSQSYGKGSRSYRSYRSQSYGKGSRVRHHRRHSYTTSRRR